MRKTDMAISLERLASFHHNVLKVRSDRLELIAGNLANANTPGYKARDLDFNLALKRASSGQKGLATTHQKHIDATPSIAPEIKFRVPDQPDTGDGNTVDMQVERNKFLETSMRFEASLMFLNGRFSGLKKALSGGGQQ